MTDEHHHRRASDSADDAPAVRGVKLPSWLIPVTLAILSGLCTGVATSTSLNYRVDANEKTSDKMIVTIDGLKDKNNKLENEITVLKENHNSLKSDFQTSVVRIEKSLDDLKKDLQSLTREIARKP